MPNDTTADPGAPNAMSYADNGNGTVTDKVTGLVWQQAVPSGTYKWGSASTAGTAQNYCATLTLAGDSDWRLPSIEELISIVDLGASGSKIDPTYFPGTPSGVFWSSTPLGTSVFSAWYINFSGGLPTAYDVSMPYNVRCVR
jgi:hypothetical protein